MWVYIYIYILFIYENLSLSIYIYMYIYIIYIYIIAEGPRAATAAEGPPGRPAWRLRGGWGRPASTCQPEPFHSISY